MTKGKLVFALHGEKLAGLWELVRIAKPGDRQEPWILFKKRDDRARSSDDYDVVTASPDSVIEHPLAADQATATAPSTSSLPSRAKKAALPAMLSP